MLINSTTEYGYVYSVKLLKLVNHQGHRSLHGLAYHNPEQVFEMRRFADDRQAENAPYLGLKAIARFMSCVLPTPIKAYLWSRVRANMGIDKQGRLKSRPRFVAKHISPT